MEEFIEPIIDVIEINDADVIQTSSGPSDEMDIDEFFK